jgi:hypothetical protein
MSRLHEQLSGSHDGALDCSEAVAEKPPHTRSARDECFEHNFALDVQTPQGPQLDDALTFSGFDGYSSVAVTHGKIRVSLSFRGWTFGTHHAARRELDPKDGIKMWTDDFSTALFGFDWSDEPPDCFRLPTDAYGEVRLVSFAMPCNAWIAGLRPTASSHDSARE